MCCTHANVFCCCAVTLGNIRETHRFNVSAWRMACLLPEKLKELKTTELKVKMWQLSVSLMFPNYNKQLKTGKLIKCSDGKTRDVVIVLAMWQGDAPEIAGCCCLIQVMVYLPCA
jgi:hypothetical protein